MSSRELALIEVHGEKTINTTSLIISENCQVTHQAVLRMVKKFENDLKEVGLVGFEIRAREKGKHGGGDVEVALLDDYAAMLLLTHMRSNEVVAKFKKALVHEFKRMKNRLNEPARKETLQIKRNEAGDMTDALIFKREQEGKETTANHFMNEHRFCNRALTGEWGDIKEYELDGYDAKLLAAIRKRNGLLIQHFSKQADRKQLLDDFVAKYRAKHPKPQMCLTA